MSQFSCPDFTELPKEVMREFLDHLDDNCEDIHKAIAAISSARTHIQLQDRIKNLFGAVHTLKGNCAMVLLNPVVMVIHELEESISQLRDGAFPYEPAFGELTATVIEATKSVTLSLSSRGTADKTTLDNLHSHLKRIKDAEPADKSNFIQNAIWMANSSNNNTADIITEAAATTAETQSIAKHEVESPIRTSDDDLKFFRTLATHFDNLSNFRDNRTFQIYSLANKLNHQLGHSIEDDQLELAVYMHDFGMALIPDDILNTSRALTKDELKRMQQHVFISAGLVIRMPEWTDAATMIYQHHERYDGSGYPNGLMGENIVLGACIIAVADTYCAMIHERSDRTYKHSVMEAVKEINANAGKQFNPLVVKAFNQVIRQDFVSKG